MQKQVGGGAPVSLTWWKSVRLRIRKDIVWAYQQDRRWVSWLNRETHVLQTLVLVECLFSPWSLSLWILETVLHYVGQESNKLPNFLYRQALQSLTQRSRWKMPEEEVLIIPWFRAFQSWFRNLEEFRRNSQCQTLVQNNQIRTSGCGAQNK